MLGDVSTARCDTIPLTSCPSNHSPGITNCGAPHPPHPPSPQSMDVHNQFFEKFNYRLYIGEVLGHLWELPSHR